MNEIGARGRGRLAQLERGRTRGPRKRGKFKDGATRMPDRDKAQGLKKDVHFRWLPLSRRRRVTGPKSPNPIVERLSSARDTFPDACSSLVSISLDDSRALRREYAATNPQFRYISIRLRGSSTIGSLCAVLEYLSLATRKGEKEMHSYILYSRFWLILVRDTA